MPDDVVEFICRNCGDKHMIQSSTYLRAARHFAGNKFVCEVFNAHGFYYGIKNKTTFRLIAIAVLKSEQGKGLASSMMCRIIDLCDRYGLKAITLRTQKNGSALRFWLKWGAIIVGEKGDDYEMKIGL